MSRASQTLLAFDYGDKRIGVAVGQTLTATASPLTTLKLRQQRPDWAAITHLIETWRPAALVVGIPVTMQDEIQPLTDKARAFARRLEGRYHLPVYGVDERLSSYAARDRLRSTYDVDAVAAQVILETWLHDQRDTADTMPIHNQRND